MVRRLRYISRVVDSFSFFLVIAVWLNFPFVAASGKSKSSSSLRGIKSGGAASQGFGPAGTLSGFNPPRERKQHIHEVRTREIVGHAIENIM